MKAPRLPANPYQRQNILLSQEIYMYRSLMEGFRGKLGFEDLLKLVIHSIRKGLGFKRVGVFLVELNGRYAKLAMGISQSGRFEKNKESIPLFRPASVKNHFSDMYQGRIQYFLTNRLQKRMKNIHEFRVKSVHNNALVPMRVGGKRILGFIAVDNLYPAKTITLSDMARLMNFATQAGLVLEAYLNQDNLKKLSTTDPLTGLANRRAFNQCLETEIARCQRYKHRFSLLMLDLDHFKRVNDSLGHEAGDLVLRQVAHAIRDSLRSMDLLARFGGEEFSLILPETPPLNLSTVISKVLSIVREMKLVIPGSIRPLQVTISVGAATYLGGNHKPEEIIRAADKSLYEAKRTGRDKAGTIQVLNSASTTPTFRHRKNSKASH